MVLCFRLNLKKCWGCACENSFQVISAIRSNNVLFDVFRHKYFFFVSYYVTIAGPSGRAI
jgi:hypothetical protein